ncbi:MAG: SoxR reducing system RseC family protein [Candidatus Cloacimonadia bacterium]
MNDEKDYGKVVDVSDDIALVEVEKSGQCNGCKLASLCFHHGKQKTFFEVRNTLDTKKGDIVELLIEPQIRVLSAFLVYILPIVAMIFAYLLCSLLIGVSENWSILVSLCAIPLSLLALRAIDKSFSKRRIGIPKMVRIIPKEKP